LKKGYFGSHDKKRIDYFIIRLYNNYTNGSKMKKILLLTKDKSLQKELSAVLPGGYKIFKRLSVTGDSIIFVDIDTLGTGLIRDYSQEAFVIAVTKKKKTGTVIEATTFGAYEIVHRPFRRNIVPRIINELDGIKEEIKDHIDITKGDFSVDPTCAIVGHSTLIMDVCKRLARLAQVEMPVLITGETGTGKELIAESITQLSQRFGKPFVVINCAAIPDALLESELFGFEKGAFTGALSPKEGFLKIADGGCVFFDEIGELPLSLQGKLLRFIQTQTFYPLGSTHEVQVNIRVISATNRDLSRMVREGKFREDLYHRLSVATIHVPPLRERKKDILPLVQFFIYRYRHMTTEDIKGITRAFLDKLHSYDWPGNIRELENSIRSAVALRKTEYLTTYELLDLGSDTSGIKEEGFSETIASSLLPFLKELLDRKEADINKKIHDEVDRHVFEYMLSFTKDNLSEAARILGINRLTLRKKLGM
jgi:DNA-binding NtrC family response regulator